MTDLLIVGSTGIDIVKLIDSINRHKKEYKIIGFLDKNPEQIGKKIYDYDVLGTDDLLLTKFKNCPVVNNVIGTTRIRFEITKKLKEYYGVKEFPSIIHPLIDCNYCEIGDGNIIYENSILGTNVKIGDFNIFYQSTIVGHESIIGNYNLIAGGSLIGARTKIGNCVYISNSSTISLGLSICDDVFIGVGSVVVNSIKKPKKVFGNPAKELLF